MTGAATDAVVERCLDREVRRGAGEGGVEALVLEASILLSTGGNAEAVEGSEELALAAMVWELEQKLLLPLEPGGNTWAIGLVNGRCRCSCEV